MSLATQARLKGSRRAPPRPKTPRLRARVRHPLHPNKVFIVRRLKVCREHASYENHHWVLFAECFCKKGTYFTEYTGKRTKLTHDLRYIVVDSVQHFKEIKQ